MYSRPFLVLSVTLSQFFPLQELNKSEDSAAVTQNSAIGCGIKFLRPFLFSLNTCYVQNTSLYQVDATTLKVSTDYEAPPHYTGVSLSSYAIHNSTHARTHNMCVHSAILAASASVLPLPPSLLF
jgi:hypothetical protein